MDKYVCNVCGYVAWLLERLLMMCRMTGPVLSAVQASLILRKSDKRPHPFPIRLKFHTPEIVLRSRPGWFPAGWGRRGNCFPAPLSTRPKTLYLYISDC